MRHAQRQNHDRTNYTLFMSRVSSKSIHPFDCFGSHCRKKRLRTKLPYVRFLTPRLQTLTFQFDAQSQETFSFLPGQWLDVHIPSIPQAGGFTITSTPADALPLPIPDPTIIQDGTENLSHQQGEFGTEAAADGRYPYVELAVQQSPSNPAAAWLWRPHKEILGCELRVRVGGSFVWPPASVRTDQIHKIVFVAGGVGIK